MFTIVLPLSKQASFLFLQETSKVTEGVSSSFSEEGVRDLAPLLSLAEMACMVLSSSLMCPGWRKKVCLWSEKHLRECGNSCLSYWFFRTFRATGDIFGNVLPGDRQQQRIERHHSLSMVELSTESAEEPTLGMASDGLGKWLTEELLEREHPEP